MATIGETLMVEKAAGKRVAKHLAADYISISIMIRTNYKWYRKYSVKFKPLLLHLSF